MKISNNKKLIFIIIVMALLAWGVMLKITDKPDICDINCECRGGIIFDKEKKMDGDGGGIVYFTIKTPNGGIRVVRAHQIDWGYEPGDTINKPCRNGIQTIVSKLYDKDSLTTNK